MLTARCTRTKSKDESLYKGNKKHVYPSTLFRPRDFGMPLFARDNASSVPLILICVQLGSSGNRTLHYILIPLITIIVILDTLVVSYEIR